MTNSTTTVILSSTIVLLLALIGYLLIPGEEEEIDPATIHDIVLNYHNEDIATLEEAAITVMKNQYKTKQLIAINENLEMNDAESVVFDLNTLKKFIYHIEVNAKKMDETVNTESLGIRIYYAAYPKGSAKEDNPSGLMTEFQSQFPSFESSPIDYSGKHTLIMVPTINEEDVNLSEATDYSALNHGHLFP